MKAGRNVEGKNYAVKDEGRLHGGETHGNKNNYGEYNSEEEFVIIPPNGGWGWVVVLSAFYCNVVTDGIQLTFGIFLPEIAKYFNTDKSKISLVGSLMFGIHLLVGPVCSGLSNVYGIRPVTVFGSCLTALGLALCYFSPAYEYLYFAYGVLGGMGLGLIYMNTIVITTLYFTSYRILAMGIVVCGTGFGTVTFALLGNELLKLLDWQTSFLIEAGLAGSMGIAALTFRPLIPKRVIVTTDQTLLMGRQSIISRASRISRISDVGSLFTMKSRRPTLYIKRDSKVTSQSIRTIAMEKIVHKTILDQLTARLCPRRCRHCTCCEREEVIYVHPQEKEETFEEITDFPLNLNESWISHSESDVATTPRSVLSRITMAPEKTKCCNCAPLKETIRVMLDFKLLRSRAFFLYCLSGCLAMSCILVVLMYEKDRSIIQHGFTQDIATYLVVTIGGANMFWRLTLGFLSTAVKTNTEITSVVLSLIGAASVISSAFWDNIYFLFSTNITFAVGIAAFAVYRPVLLVDLVGSDLLLNASGISLLFMGVGCIMCPPISGLIMEATNDYNTVVYIAGTMLALSGLLLIRIRRLRENELKRSQNRAL